MDRGRRSKAHAGAVRPGSEWGPVISKSLAVDAILAPRGGPNGDGPFPAGRVDRLPYDHVLGELDRGGHEGGERRGARPPHAGAQHLDGLEPWMAVGPGGPEPARRPVTDG